MNHIVEYKHVKAKMYRASWDRNRKIAREQKKEQKGKRQDRKEKMTESMRKV